MIYTQSMNATETVLVAQVAVWRALLTIQPLPTGRSISHVKQPGEVFSQAEWQDIANRITKATDGKDDDNTVRIWFDRDVATQLLGARSAKK